VPAVEALARSGPRRELEGTVSASSSFLLLVGTQVKSSLNPSHSKYIYVVVVTSWWLRRGGYVVVVTSWWSPLDRSPLDGPPRRAAPVQ